jgi:Pilus formation protein N terminal region
MTRRTLIATASLALSAAAAFVGTGATVAADRNIGGMEVVSSDDGGFVSLTVNKSVVIKLPKEIKDVLVGNSKIVNAVLRTNQRAYISGLAVGETDVFFFDAEGRRIGALDIYVTRDPPPARFIGPLEPQNLVSIYNGASSAAVHCDPTRCVAPTAALPELPAGYSDIRTHSSPNN